MCDTKLNKLNEKLKVFTTKNTVPIMKLIKAHNPQSEKELEELIEYHHTHQCTKCDVKSTGNIQHFANLLYQAQLKEFNCYKYSYQECYQWTYGLFITKSLKGNTMENKAISYLKEKYPIYTYKIANNKQDIDFRVDILVELNKQLVGGVQVKPMTYIYVDKNIKTVNKILNNKFKLKVLYLYYNKENQFIHEEIHFPTTD